MNVNEERLLFTTEGHIIPLRAEYHQSLRETKSDGRSKTQVCRALSPLIRYALPIDELYWRNHSEMPWQVPSLSAADQCGLV